jgi:predicted oxidoreductase
MRMYRVANTDLEISRLAYGCMGLGGGWGPEPLAEDTVRSAVVAIRTALDVGINFFDHADIYGRGKSEEAFARIWSEVPHLRGRILLQSKCGIRFAGDPDPGAPGRYDFSYAHILQAVEGSLRRLTSDHLDVLLLHRPDPLVEPDEVARAFHELESSGKVRYFGVSNHTPGQIELLRASVDQPLVFNQVELNVLHANLIDEGVSFNQNLSGRTSTWTASTLEYCRLREITLQAWSPMARGALTGHPINGAEGGQATAAAQVVAELAVAHGVSPEAIPLAWLLRHPAGIQPVIGTTRPEHIEAACQADGVELTREEWYRLFAAGRGASVP